MSSTRDDGKRTADNFEDWFSLWNVDNVYKVCFFVFFYILDALRGGAALCRHSQQESRGWWSGRRLSTGPVMRR